MTRYRLTLANDDNGIPGFTIPRYALFWNVHDATTNEYIGGYMTLRAAFWRGINGVPIQDSRTQNRDLVDDE